MDTLNSRPVLHYGSRSHYVAQAVGRFSSLSPKRNFGQTSKDEPPKKKIRMDNGSPDILQEQGSKSTKLTPKNSGHLMEDLPSTPSKSLNGRQKSVMKGSRAAQFIPLGTKHSKPVQAPWPVPTSTTNLAPPPMRMEISDDDEEENEASFTKGAAQERREREDLDDDIQEINHTKHISSRTATKSSTISAQQRLSSSQKRLEELDEILPDDMLQQGQKHRSSPDVIQDLDSDGGCHQRTTKRSRTALQNKSAENFEEKTPTHVKLYRPIRMLFGRAPADASDYVFSVDKVSHTFAIRYGTHMLGKDLLLPNTPVDRIRKIAHGKNGAMMRIETSEMNVVGHEILLELSSHRLIYELAMLLTKLGTGINVRAVDDQWLDRVFEKFYQIRNEDHSRRRSQQKPDTQSPYVSVTGSATDSRRHSGPAADHAANGRSSTGANSATPWAESQQGQSASARRLQMMTEDLEKRPGQEASNRDSEGREEKILRYRVTRAYTTRTSPEPSARKYPHFESLVAPWKAPLTYPRNGKKRATVNFDDLSRLDDDEFLNDSIIAFFMRYLEHYLEQEQPAIAKRTHFFNSYFYEKLRQNPKDKKSINYEGVKKWTDKIGLFNRDFIVVPVNENLHWYLAIICNLSWFKLSQKDKDAADVPDVVDQSLVDLTPAPEPDTVMENTEHTQQSLQELTLEDRERQGHVIISDLVPESSGKPSGSAKKKGRKRKSERPLPTVNSKKPAIITLDSLGLTRYATVKALKQYIVQEGKEKLHIDIDEADIHGLAAKRMPTQKNFSDCGLFVCAYLEKFAMDPAGFKTMELERRKQNWGELDSHDLRSRMRELIQMLHAKQEGEEVDNTVPAVGEILLPSPQLSPNDGSDSADNGDETMYDFPTTPLSPDARRTSKRVQVEIRDQALDSRDEVIVADPSTLGGNRDQDPKNIKARTAKILRKPSPQPAGAYAAYSDPAAMAQRTRELRSPEQGERGRSVSTDFLGGDESYEYTGQQMPDVLIDAEVMLV